MSRRVFFFLLLILPVLGIQCAKITRPYLGHFSSYQLVMSTMARNMMRENFTELLLPKTDLLVNGQRSLHLNQYPFPSVIAALGAKLSGGSLEFWGRFQSILWNLGSILLIGLLAARLWREKYAWVAMTLFAYSPFTLIYGQGFFSEPLSLFFFLLSFHFLMKSERSLTVLWAGLAFSLALTGRIHWVLYFPIPVLWIFLSNSKNRFTNVLIFGVSALLLPVAWYVYTYFAAIHSDRVLTNIFLQTGMRQWGDQNYLLNPAYYKRILFVFAGTMLALVMTPFFIWGFFLRQTFKIRVFLFSGVLAGLLIAVLSPQKIMAHDFYLYATFPFVCFITTCGMIWVLENFSFFQKRIPLIFFGILYLSLGLLFSYNSIFKYSEDFSVIQQAATVVNQQISSDQPIIVAGNSVAALAYYSDHPFVTLDLGNVGGKVPAYLSNPKYAKADVQEIANLENAMKNPIDWLVYLKKKGAYYCVSVDKKEIEKMPLLQYLQTHNTALSNPTDKFYLFRLKS